jgi:hypothetical protein
LYWLDIVALPMAGTDVFAFLNLNQLIQTVKSANRENPFD